MTLPEQLEELRNRKIWLCYPLIWNEKKHGGVGGYDKPPVNPYTLYNGASDDPRSLATFDEAAAQIGKTAHVRVPKHDGLVECPIAGVGIAFAGTGIFGLDMDNVVKKTDDGKYLITDEAVEIMYALKGYTEISPSETGLHVIGFGKLPEGKKLAKPKRDIFGTEKAEYQLFDSGYMTVTGDRFGGSLKDCTEIISQIYEKYFREVAPIISPSTQRPSSPATSSSVVSSGTSRERWLEDVRRLSDAEILDGIMKSPKYGDAVRRLYDGDMSAYGDDHSRADQALCTMLYSFTDDRALTERLFRASRLYRATGKSRTYLERTLERATQNAKPLVGHIKFTDDELRAYAQKKEAEETAAGVDRNGNRLDRYTSTRPKKQTAGTKRFNSKTKASVTNDRRKI